MSSIKQKLGQYQFSTIVSVAGDDIFDIEHHEIVNIFNSSSNPFLQHPKVIIADPFLFVHKNELYLFYEEQIDLRGKGLIKMTKTKDLVRWSNPVIVLEESFHLSYPNVFEVNGDIYMMPETGHDLSIKLYKANNDLTKWTYHKTLLEGKNFVDSSIVYYDNLYFLFTTEYIKGEYILYLFFSESLDNKWIEHPQSPISKSPDEARCAGSVFSHNNKLYRPCQLTSEKYGGGVDIYEIITINTKEYKEKNYRRIIPNYRKEYSEGGHHFNKCNWNDKHIIATDIIKFQYNFFEIIRRIKAKI
ncbi:MAG: glycosyl transferase [Bacteroidales bacterium]